MRIVLTVLCRDEADIIDAMVRFHLSRGVDFIIATDNGSIDGTDCLLAEYERAGVLRLLREPAYTHDQAKWVTRMARMAALEFGADWVINSDADEFWWTQDGDLKSLLNRVPASVKALAVGRTNFLPPDAAEDGSQPFYMRQRLREAHSLSSLGEPIAPKVCHRAYANISVRDGNHSVKIEGQTVPASSVEGLEILHFPVRSVVQLERKIRQGTQAIFRNPRLTTQIGRPWRHIYGEHLIKGTLDSYYAGLRPAPSVIRAHLLSGLLILDERIARALQELEVAR